MKRYFISLLLVLAAMLPMAGAEKVWLPDEIEMVHLQDARRYVCNPDGVLEQADVDSIDRNLYRLEQTKGVQSVVVVVRRLENGDPYTFGMEIARKQGVGSKRQNSGLIVILSTEDRKYQILTGTGLEGALPDAICKRIENRYMLPYLKKSDWGGAMRSGIEAICGYVEKDPELTAELQEEEDGGGGLAMMLMLFFIFLFVVVIRSSRYTRCPNCGRKSYRRISSHYLFTRMGWDYYNVTYSCRRCGYSTTKRERSRHDDDDGSGIVAGAALGSMLAGRRGLGGGSFGGGFGGGSFGGGSFGGGGAGGSF